MSQTATVDSDPYADSLPAQIAALDIGECLMRGERLELRKLNKEKLAQHRRMMRNSGSAAVARAKNRKPRAEWSAEVGEFFDSTDGLFLCLVITRKA